MITQGVVTAAYPTGGFNGYYLQTPGTGGALDLSTHDTSDGLFVFAGSGATYPQVGDYLQVTGKVTEFAGMTELTPAAGGVTTLTDQVTAPAPATVGFPATDASRESLEGMLRRPAGRLHGHRQLLAQPVRRDRPRARHPAAAAVRPTWPKPGPAATGRRGRQRHQEGRPRRRLLAELPHHAARTPRCPT